jgi:hypothetical protein
MGGLGTEYPADEHLRNVVSTVKELIKNRYSGAFRDLEPISYKAQVVAGLNYFVKVSWCGVSTFGIGRLSARHGRTPTRPRSRVRL